MKCKHNGMKPDFDFVSPLMLGTKEPRLDCQLCLRKITRSNLARHVKKDHRKALLGTSMIKHGRIKRNISYGRF